MERHDYERFAQFWEDPQPRKWTLWSYVDESHVGEALRRALGADVAGEEAFIIARDSKYAPAS